MQFDINFICQATGGELVYQKGNPGFLRVTTDSRTIQTGDLFIALKGDNFDGHDYINEALQKGAAGAIVANTVKILPDLYKKVAIIQVKDTLAALQKLASAHRNRFDLPVIAVTGSVGKTTTKDILATLLQNNYQVLKTEGNFNNEIGLPLTLLRLNSSYEAAVVELAMRSRGEIAHLASLCRPAIAIITNVEPVHLETMGSLENIAQAKCEVLQKVESFAVINGDNNYLQQAAADYSCSKYTFGYNKDCDFRIINSHINKGKLWINAKILEETIDLQFPLPALRLAPVITAAAGTAMLMDISIPDIQTSLAGYEPSGNRLAMINLPQGGLIINDTYNANPLSMAAALETARELAAGRRIVAVLGDMFELGEYEQQGHLEVGRKVALSGVDLLVTIGTRAETITKGARETGMTDKQIAHFIDLAECHEYLRENLSKQDVILFKASRGMKFELIIDKWLEK